jgi:hypothetical protein
MFNLNDVTRWHNASKMIEADLHEAVRSCAVRYGTETAGLLLVYALRQQLNPEEQWPEPENLRQKVNDFLQHEGLLNDVHVAT